MIQLTDYLGETLNIDEQVIVTVSNYTQNSVAGAKVEYRVNPNSIAVIYVTDTPSDISGMTDYVVPITLVFDNGQTEVIYLNPVYYRGFLTLSPANQLQYEYQIGSQYRVFSTSTTYSTLVAQINATGGGGSGFWTQSGGNLYPTTLSDSVGIGTDTPLALLHVVGGTIGTENADQLNGINYGFLGGIGQILYVGATATDYNGFEISDNDNVITGRDLSTGSLLRLVANDGDANFTERVTFLNNGNVGIGTNTPTSKLTVNDGDIEINNKNNGLIVYSQDVTAWRIGVSDLGVVTATAV